jgi:sugar-phosphatase
MPQFHCSAILFDLDGVLIDSTASVSRQYRAWSLENGLDPEFVLRNAHGVRTVEVIQRVAPHLDPEVETLKIEKREVADHAGVTAIPGAPELTRFLPRERWGVVTSGRRHLATGRLHLGGIEVPKVLVTAEEVQRGKPDPEPYLKGAERLGFPPKDCIVFEDAPAGIESAHAANMKVIALSSTYPASELIAADAIIKNFHNAKFSFDSEGITIVVD